MKTKKKLLLFTSVFTVMAAGAVGVWMLLNRPVTYTGEIPSLQVNRYHRPHEVLL